MEPAWMKKFSNATVCNFFYFWFVVYAVFALMALFLTIGTFFSLKKIDFFGVMIVLQPVITLLLATAFMMFYYIICDRSLLAKVSESVVQEGFEAKRAAAAPGDRYAGMAAELGKGQTFTGGNLACSQDSTLCRKPRVQATLWVHPARMLMSGWTGPERPSREEK